MALCAYVVCFSLNTHRFHLTGAAGMDTKSSAGVLATDVDAVSDVGSSHCSPGGRGRVSTGRWDGRAQPPPAPACAAATHTASASQAAGRWWDVVGVCLWADCKFFFFSVYLSLSLFLLKEMRGSIDWEDRLPLCGQKRVSAARKYVEITKSRLYFFSSLNEILGCHSYER